MNDLNELNGLQPQSAKDLAEKLLGWAKHKNLFDKIPLDEGIEEEDSQFQVGPNQFHAQAAEDVLRKRSINLVGFSEDEKKVIIFTHNKVSKGDEKVLPFTFGGYTVVYSQGGIAYVKGNPPQPQQPRPFNLRNGRYTCGSSIFPAHCIGAGTFGLIVSDAAGELYGMTNNHVAGACNHAMPGLPILAPGPVDAIESACDPFTIGRHSRLLPINDGIPENIDISQNCDVSLFKLTDPAKVTSFQGDAYDTPALIATPQPGQRVRKYGRTTGLTTGKLVAQVASAMPVAYNVNEYNVRKSVWFDTIFVVEGDNNLPFSRPGDSGSLVVSQDAAGNPVAVGLVFAGNEQRNQSFILPLPDVMQKLGVTIVTGHHV